MKYANIQVGDPAPWFHQRSFANPRYALDVAAGRYIVLCFFGSAAIEQSRAAIVAAFSRQSLFDDVKACFFGVSVDVSDETENRVADRYPGYRFLWDFDGSVSKLYGALPVEAIGNDNRKLMLPRWVILNPRLQVLDIVPFADDGGDINKVLGYVETLPAVDRCAGTELHAPIIVLPNVFEPHLCERLIRLYEENGGKQSGFMREMKGKTVEVHDHRHKSRKDYIIDNQDVINETQLRFRRRVAPEIQKVHQFAVTRMERYIVSCYAQEDRAHFNAHRDNTTKGTAHRRFAVSVNLNDDFDGGEVSFPEYGSRSFKAPAGGAVIFSCSLLHAVSTVTRGRRYAFLPFLYDDEGAKIREVNKGFLSNDGN